MTYKWYYIFNADDFNTEGLVSQTYTVILDGIGQKDILVTKANYLGLTYDGVFLPLNMSEKNPFKFDSHAIYVDENENVFLGFLQGDE